MPPENWKTAAGEQVADISGWTTVDPLVHVMARSSAMQIAGFATFWITYVPLSAGGGGGGRGGGGGGNGGGGDGGGGGIRASHFWEVAPVHAVQAIMPPALAAKQAVESVELIIA